MHIEPTSRCVLSCPGCSRTAFSRQLKRPFPKQDLDLDNFYRFLDCESGKSVETFTLNGNHGDPIYYPKLIELLQRFRDRRFRISTNGSYMSENFWKTLSENLTKDDVVYFSIDGLEHNNHLYRKNSDWNSIMRGLKIISKGPPRVIWKSIVFSYNQNDLQEMERTAKDLGAEFIAETTGHFGDDSLRPADTKLIRTDLLFSSANKVSEIHPRCEDGKAEFISADGFYWPCCMISNSQILYKTSLWKNRDHWRIDSQTLDQARQKVKAWANSVRDQGSDAPAACKVHCKPNQSGYVWPQI